MPVALTNLAKSLEALRRSTEASRTLPEATSPELRETVEAGVVKCFEVAFEQSIKAAHQWLRENCTAEATDFLRTRKELFRTAAHCGLIADPVPWFAFSEARNRVAQTFDSDTAFDVFSVARAFFPYAMELFSNMAMENE